MRNKVIAIIASVFGVTAKDVKLDKSLTDQFAFADIDDALDIEAAIIFGDFDISTFSSFDDLTVKSTPQQIIDEVEKMKNK